MNQAPWEKEYPFGYHGIHLLAHSTAVHKLAHQDEQWHGHEEKLVFDSHALFAMMFQSGASEKKNIMTKDRTPNAAETYIPAMKKAPIRPNATPIATLNTL